MKKIFFFFFLVASNYIYCFLIKKLNRNQVLCYHWKPKTFSFFFYFFLFFIFNCKVLTYNTYLQTMYDTYATNRTILYLQYKKTCNTYLQWDTYTTNSAILHALHIYKKKPLLALLTLRITYATKTEKKGGVRGSVVNFCWL